MKTKSTTSKLPRIFSGSKVIYDIDNPTQVFRDVSLDTMKTIVKDFRSGKIKIRYNSYNSRDIIQGYYLILESDSLTVIITVEELQKLIDKDEFEKMLYIIWKIKLIGIEIIIRIPNDL